MTSSYTKIMPWQTYIGDLEGVIMGVRNQCKLIPTPMNEFKTYHECAYFGYDYSSILLKEFDPNFVDTYRTYTAFFCKENQTI